jgi:hypothetical protein
MFITYCSVPNLVGVDRNWVGCKVSKIITYTNDEHNMKMYIHKNTFLGKSEDLFSLWWDCGFLTK